MYENLKDINILYVEDDQFINEQTSSLLKVIFKEVYTAFDGEEGLELFKKHSNDIQIVVTDINMPKICGSTMAKGILEIKKDMPVIAVSAYSLDEEVIEQSIEVFADYLRKPVQIKELLEIIQKALFKDK